MKWSVVSLRDIADIEMGQSPPGVTYNDRGDGLPFFQGKADFGDVHPTVRKWCSAPTRVAEVGDILLSVRAPVGPVNVARERCCIGRGLAAIRSRPPHVRQDYLRVFFKYVAPSLAAIGQGSTFAAIGRPDLENVTLPLPPISEQTRIADILNQADALRRRRAEADQKTERILSALFKSMFGEPTTNPKGWDVVELGDLSTKITSGSRGWSERTGRGDALFVRTQDIRDGRILADLLSVDPPSGAEAERTRLSQGDVAITITGEVGKAAVFRDWDREVYVSQHVALVRPKPTLHAEYLTAVVNLGGGSVPYLARVQYGQTKPGLGFRELRTAPIPVPPIELQERFAVYAQRIFAFQDKQRYLRRCLEKLWATLLGEAFSGRLTAKWREGHMRELLAEMELQAATIQAPRQEALRCVSGK